MWQSKRDTNQPSRHEPDEMAINKIVYRYRSHIRDRLTGSSVYCIDSC